MHTLTRTRPQPTQTALVIAGMFVALVALFVLTPWSGDDWNIYYHTGKRVLAGEAIYGTPITYGYYNNPPWFALLLAAVSPLPRKLGWAMLCASSLMATLALLRAWTGGKAGIIKPLCVLLSPSMLYVLLHGQIDALVIAGALLPAAWWPLVALTKPQVAIALAVGTPPRLWLRAAVILAIAFGVTLLIFGLWPRDLLNQPTPFMDESHNLWKGLWPFQVPAGILLVTVGLQRRDERFLIAASPFLSPYAALSSLFGLWLAAVTFLEDWQAAVVFASWWGAVLARAFL